MNKFKKVILLITIVLIVCVKLLNMNNLYVFFGIITQNTILNILYIMLLISLFSILNGNLYVIRILLILTVMLLSAFTVWNFKKSTEEIFIFQSPDQTNTLLIQDSIYTRYYVKRTFFIYESLKVDLAATGIQSFKTNHYSITWSSNTMVEVEYLLFGSKSYFNVVLDLNNADKLHEGSIYTK